MATEDQNLDTMIPWSGTIKLLLRLSSFASKWKIGRNLAREIRDRVLWGFASGAHIEHAHSLRTFAHKAYIRGLKNLSPEDTISLASSERDVMAKLLGVPNQDIHCTIKLCHWPQGITDKGLCEIHTIARSEPCERPPEYYPKKHLAKDNSAFASLVGCDDNKNRWTDPFCCFLCNDLTKENFDCSRENWQKYFKAALVFPLRNLHYAKGQSRIVGFLTFDSEKTSIFGRIPNIFSYRRKNKSTYNTKCIYSTVVQVGGLLADTLFMTVNGVLIYEKQRGENNGN